jgi:hypothetical protein
LVIAEHEIDTVFDDRAIALLRAVLKSSASAKLFTETDRQRFADSIRTAVRCYLAESARTDWPAITKHIGKLYSLIEKADGGKAEAVAELAKQVDATDPATREWLQRCVHQELPSAGEIENKETRRRLRRMLCDGWDRVEGRKRPGGRHSRSRQLWLRVPQNISSGRPLDLAARELVQQLALTYLEATGKPPPKRVNSKRPGPFFKFVERVFKMTRLHTGNVEDLINEREERRRHLGNTVLKDGILD